MCSDFLHLISSVSWNPRCFTLNAFFFPFYFICVHVERVTELVHTPTCSTQGSLNSTSFSTLSLVSLALHIFFHPPWTLEGQWRKRKKKKKEPFGLCRLSICADRLKGGPGLLSQQRTTHLLSRRLLGLITESKHSGSVILLVSQGRLLIQFSPQHCTVVWYSDGGSGGEKKNLKKENSYRTNTRQQRPMS